MLTKIVVQAAWRAEGGRRARDGTHDRIRLMQTEIMAMPQNARMHVKNFPPGVRGPKSPYPTVVKVATAKYTLGGLRGGTSWWAR